MNNENQSQNKVQQNDKTPDDLLCLVKDSVSPVQSSNNNVNNLNNSDDNKFIKDFSNVNGVNNKNQITNTKLNLLLGSSSLPRANNSFDFVENVNSENNNSSNLNTAPISKTDIKIQNESGANLDALMKNTYNYKIDIEQKTIRSNKFFLIAAIGSGVCFVFILMFSILSGGFNFSFRGGEAYYQNKTFEKTGEFQTVVVTDNIYKNVTINNKDDAKALIVKDSNNQKNKCENLKVKEVESRIEEKYEIVAVNLCELDYNFALEIEKILDSIHKEFPNTIKGYLTNLTLSNMGEGGSIATFVSAKLFAKANTFTSYPNVYKTSISLNAEYFLNLKRFTYEMQQSAGSWFVKNATKSSIVAHEFGHYLSFFAQLKNTQDIDEVILLTKKNYSSYYNLINDSNNGVFSRKIVQEAYDRYKKEKPNKFVDVEEFMRSISEYAAIMDDFANPIYDEAIAEAFHDWYLNKQKAADASKKIVTVLKEYINK